ncbi:hypothetical protein FPV67DRAFT_996493 [Lyophyllum atratum]|nr:hypothetical protein FPV67DRAFT_996493 [Lyophyllum atratum]
MNRINVCCQTYVASSDSFLGVTDLALVQSHMGSRTIEKIVSRLCKSDQPVHAEVVLRSDLRERYLKMRQEMQQAATQRLPDRREKDVMWEYGQEEIVFHGTSYKNVGSIVRSGFVVPGQRAASGKAIGIRCGTTWGQGIYTSPSPSYGLRYANYAYKDGMKGRHRLLPGQKLIVCAVLMGRRHHVVTPRRLNTNVEPGFDSHVSPNKKEYIVFNSAQVLPLYVLHLGYQHVPSADPGLPMSLSLYQPGNLTEYARKHLPTGYGVARGHKFVVTAIAPADDDEELWGQYQYTNADEWDGFEEDD